MAFYRIDQICFVLALVLAGIGAAAAPALAAEPALERLAPDQWKPIAQEDLAAAIEEAAALKVESALPGPRDVWCDGVRWVKNPDGKTWDAWILYSKAYMGPHQAVIIDFGTGELKIQPISSGKGKDPAQSGSFMFHLAQTLTINGKVYYHPYTPREKTGIWMYDPAANELRFGGYPVGDDITGGRWAVGPDEKIYGIGEKEGKFAAYRIDPETFKAEVFDTFGPTNPNLTWMYADGRMDGDWMYLKAGNQPWYLLAYNFKTRQSLMIAETEKFIGDGRTIRWIAAMGGGCNVSIDKMLGSGGKRREFWLKEGTLTPIADLPADQAEKATTKPSVKPSTADQPQVNEQSILPDLDGKVRLWYRPAGAAKGPEGWKKIEYQVDRYPGMITLLAPLPGGRLLGTGDAYAEAVMFDPAKNKSQRLGQQPRSIYSLAALGNMVYTSAYPSSQVAVIDADKPWTVLSPDGPPPEAKKSKDSGASYVTWDKSANPHLVAKLMEFTHVHIPLGTVIGADGKVYVGGMIERIGNGGGLGWYDPKTEQSGGILKPFTAYKIFWMCSAKGGRYILCSTKPVQDDEDPKIHPKTGRLFVFDTQTMSMKYFIESPSGQTPGPIAEALDGLVMGHAPAGDLDKPTSGLLWGLDVESGKVLWTKPVPAGPVTGFSLMRRHRYHFDRGPDGKIWSFFGSTLVRIDPRNASIEALGNVGKPAMLGFAAGRVFMAGEGDLLEIKDLK